LLLQQTQHALAELVGAHPEELMLTAGTTDAISTGIRLVYHQVKNTRNHIISCVTEHPAVLDTLAELKKEGAEISYLSVDREGLADTDEFRALIQDNTGLLCLMGANNETGVIHPLEKFSAICRENGLLFFSDGSQYVGKLRCDVTETGFDLLAFGSHKMYGPAGIGALYVSKQVAPVQNQMSGQFSPQQLAGFAEAARVFIRDHWELYSEISRLRGYFEHQLLELPGLIINGSTRHRLYNTSNLSFPSSIDTVALSKKFKILEYCGKTSHVLKAMSIDEERIARSCRFSFGRFNSLGEIKLFLAETGIFSEG